MGLRRRTGDTTGLHRLQRRRCSHRLLRRLRQGRVRRWRLSLLTLLSAITRLCWLRLVVHRVAHRALYRLRRNLLRGYLLRRSLLRGYLLIGRLRGRYLLIHRLVLLLLQYLPPNLTRTTARGAQRREKRYRRAD